MKQSCRDLEPLLTPYVDGEATADQCAAVEAHLRACRTCRDCADALAHVRQLLHDCRAELQDHAPADLRTRLAQLARSVEPSATPGEPSSRTDEWTAAAATPAVAPAWRRWAAPLSLAATVLLVVVAILLYGQFSQRSTAFASQLAADHLRCMRLVSAKAPADAASQAAAWRQARGWPITLPASSSSDDMQFVMLRRCISADGTVAHALYRHQGRIVSLYIAQKGDRDPQVLEVMGQQTCIWNQDGYSYAVVGAVSAEEMTRLVAWFRRRVHEADSAR